MFIKPWHNAFLIIFVERINKGQKQMSDAQMRAESVSKIVLEKAQIELELVYARACIKDLAGALSSVDNWFNALKKKQNELLCHGFKEACDNWDEATNLDIFDMEPIQKALKQHAEEIAKCSNK